ncbi:MAG: hypothetical protein KY449_12390 [Proteobacteria bacterium]|nr:hypothetical protein [Pseudomonadota bacterium]
MAHELAHQWWGNLVTCESWSEFWLNEGVTTYMVAAWKEHRWGRAAYDREMEIARRGRERAAAAGFDKPLSWPGDYPSLRVRRAVQYGKGALFMGALRGQLGDAVFWGAEAVHAHPHLRDGEQPRLPADFRGRKRPEPPTALRPMGVLRPTSQRPRPSAPLRP